MGVSHYVIMNSLVPRTVITVIAYQVSVSTLLAWMRTPRGARSFRHEDGGRGSAATKTEAQAEVVTPPAEPPSSRRSRGPISGYSALSDEANRLLEGVGLVPCRRLLGCLT